MTTATATQPVIFASKSPNLRLVRIAQDVIRNEGGRKVAEIAPSSRHNERYGVEEDGAPWEAQFEGGLFSTDDPILIEWLRNHPRKGVQFYEQDPLPEELQPTLSEQNARITRAAARLDVDDLQAVLDEEKAEHNRSLVIEGAEAALQAIAEAPEQGVDDANPDPGDPPSTSQP